MRARGALSQRCYICTVRTFITVIAVALLALFLAENAAAQKPVSFPTEDGGLIYADVYGEGERAVVLAHGGRFNRESWEKQARTLASAGFRVLALDFRGYGKSRGPGDSDPADAPLHLDVLAAVRYQRSTGAKRVSVIGASMGAGAAGDASIASQPGEIDRLVFLGGAPNGPAEKLKSPLSLSSPATTPAETAPASPAFSSNTTRLPNLNPSVPPALKSPSAHLPTRRPTKSVRIRTSTKRACNSRRIRTSKIQDLKSFRIRTYEKRGRGSACPEWHRGVSSSFQNARSRCIKSSRD
jgi:pimeloyl-ACP methyl ester carboxylesterase